MEQYLLRQRILNMISSSVQQDKLFAPCPPSYYEKVRLTHGLPWEKLVRKKGHQHFYMSETGRFCSHTLKAV